MATAIERPIYTTLGLGLLAAAAVSMPGCGAKPSEGVDRMMKEGVYGGVVPVESLSLVPQTFDEHFPAAGVIEADEEVTVSAEIAGRIVQVAREIGDAVRPGDLLVSLDDRAIRARVAKIEAQLERARTQLEWARKELERQERLFHTAVAAERARDEARRLVDVGEDDVRAAEAELEMALVDLDRCRIRSPLRGAVARRHVSSGEYVTPGTQLYDLVSTAEVKFVFSVAERDVTSIGLGENIELRVDAHPGEVFRGGIRAISPAGSARTRTFRVELGLGNRPSHPLLPGMSGTADVVRARYDDVFLLPESAILRDGSSSYVYVVEGGVARHVDISILGQAASSAVVAADFDPGEGAIILGQAAVTDGTAIRVRRRHDSPPERAFD